MGGRILTTAEIATVLQWDTQKTRRWLQRAGATTKVGSRYVTTPRQLAANWPDLWAEIMCDVGDERPL